MPWQHIRFTYSTTDVDIEEAPEAGYERALDKYQVVGRVAAGDLYTYDKGVDKRRWMLTFNGLSDTEKTNLYNFFNNDTDGSPKGVNGVMNTFTYRDENGNTWTARFLTPTIVFSKVTDNAWNVAFELEVS